MGIIRAFIGIELGDLQKSELAILVDSLHKVAKKARWKSKDNLHLTLKFLAEVSDAQLAAIDAAMMDLAQRCAPLQLEFTQLGQFRGRDSIRVVWLGLTGDLAHLQRLQRDIEQRLVPVGFVAESRPYSPHVTLGQDVVFTQKFGAIQQAIGPISIDPVFIDHLTLFKSEQQAGRRVYTPIRNYHLNG